MLAGEEAVGAPYVVKVLLYHRVLRGGAGSALVVGVRVDALPSLPALLTFALCARDAMPCGVPGVIDGSGRSCNKFMEGASKSKLNASIPR